MQLQLQSQHIQPRTIVINVTGSNVLIDAGGNVKVTDYGISKELHVRVIPQPHQLYSIDHNRTSILVIVNTEVVW